jgi:hypothetical protein
MFPLLRRLYRQSPVHFLRHGRSYTRSCLPDPSLTEHTEIVDTLVRDGICVLEGYLDSEATARIREEVGEVLFRLRDGEPVEGVPTTSYPAFACYHMDQVEHHSPASRVFTDDPMILSVAAAYGGGRAVPFNTRAELRSAPLKNELVDDLHADTWKFRFKAMLYLTDVTPETSPFRFLAGSHVGTNWPVRRFAYDYLGQAFHGHPGVERLRLAEAQRRYEDPRFRKMICTGPAGTVILFDTRGLHSATTLQSGSRMILNRTFVLKEELPAGGSPA